METQGQSNIGKTPDWFMERGNEIEQLSTGGQEEYASTDIDIYMRTLTGDCTCRNQGQGTKKSECSFRWWKNKAEELQLY